MYLFCSNNVLYSAILSFTMFIFLLSLFDTQDCYYFKSNISQMLLIKVLVFKKACNVKGVGVGCVSKLGI